MSCLFFVFFFENAASRTPGVLGTWLRSGKVRSMIPINASWFLSIYDKGVPVAEKKRGFGHTSTQGMSCTVAVYFPQVYHDVFMLSTFP